MGLHPELAPPALCAACRLVDAASTRPRLNAEAMSACDTMMSKTAAARIATPRSAWARMQNGVPGFGSVRLCRVNKSVPPHLLQVHVALPVNVPHDQHQPQEEYRGEERERDLPRLFVVSQTQATVYQRVCTQYC